PDHPLRGRDRRAAAVQPHADQGPHRARRPRQPAARAGRAGGRRGDGRAVVPGHGLVPRREDRPRPHHHRADRLHHLRQLRDAVRGGVDPPARRPDRRGGAGPQGGTVIGATVHLTIPLVFAGMLFGKRMPRGGAEVGIVAVLIGFVLSLIVASHFWGGNNGAYEAGITWINFGSFKVQLSEHVDGLASMMFVVVTLVSLCVQVYSL